MEELKFRLSRLLEQDEWTVEDKQWLLEYLQTTNSSELQSLMSEHFNNADLKALLNKDESQEILAGIHHKISVNSKVGGVRVFSVWYQRIAAAAVIGFCILAMYLVVQKNWNRELALSTHRSPIKTHKNFKNDLPPGGNKALLTLADGTTIVLDDVQNGTLAQQGKTRVFKIDGKLAYRSAISGKEETLFNTISTPRGGEYRVQLPDGSEVWLNAASSIHFPTTFTGMERRVEITGEAYFEVAKNASMPFIVKVNTSEVKVFGTHFNIMAYNEENALKTTLLEGSVEFSNNGKKVLLNPGQQSELIDDGQLKVLKNIDIENAVAWKNGYFHFDKTEVTPMMRQIARWYDVEILYESSKTNEKFIADIPRDSSLSVTLKALELTGKIQFDVEGNKVIVK